MINPKKSLGQNFLKSKATAAKIVARLNPSPTDTVVEIGPGTGALTEPLIASHAEVYAVDIDSRMTSFLKQKYHRARKFHVIQCDILDLDFAQAVSESRLKVVGNLPYHMTSPIIEKLCENHKHIDRAVVTVQKELAIRLTAEVGDSEYSSLTIFTDNFCEKQILFSLSPKEFHPPPKVISSVIKLDFFEQPRISYEEYDRLRRMIRLFFQQRRKMAINSFVKFSDLTKQVAEEIFQQAEILTRARPQELSLKDYIRLYNTWRKYEEEKM